MNDAKNEALIGQPMPDLDEIVTRLLNGMMSREDAIRYLEDHRREANVDGWRSAIILCHNLAVQNSDRHNANDESEACEAAANVAARIRPYFEVNEVEIEEMLSEEMGTEAIDPTNSTVPACNATRWLTLCELWAASTVLELRQDEAGTWTIKQIEPVENETLKPITGSDPDDAIDKVVYAGQPEPPEDIVIKCPDCPDGNRWTREGPAGRCPTCKGLAYLRPN